MLMNVDNNNHNNDNDYDGGSQVSEAVELVFCWK